MTNSEGASACALSARQTCASWRHKSASQWLILLLLLQGNRASFRAPTNDVRLVLAKEAPTALWYALPEWKRFVHLPAKGSAPGRAWARRNQLLRRIIVLPFGIHRECFGQAERRRSRCATLARQILSLWQNGNCVLRRANTSRPPAELSSSPRCRRFFKIKKINWCWPCACVWLEMVAD